MLRTHYDAGKAIYYRCWLDVVGRFSAVRRDTLYRDHKLKMVTISVFNLERSDLAKSAA